MYLYIYISEGGIYPYRRISSLRTLRGLVGQRSWVVVVVVVVVPRPWNAPRPPNWNLTDRPGFQNVFPQNEKAFDDFGAIFSAEVLTFRGGPT